MPVIEAIHEFSVEECQRMLLEQKYKSESNQDYPIKLDEENVIAYTSIGRIYQDEKGNSFCNGVDVFDHKSNKVLRGVVETTSIRVIVRRNVPVRFEQKTGKTGIDLMTETEVPCSLRDRGCHGTTTYLWSDVTNKCNLVRIQDLHGYFTEDGKFVDDKAGVLLENMQKAQPHTKCSLEVRRSGLHGFLLVDPNQNLEPLQDFSAEDFDITQLVVERDNYLHYKLEREMNDRENQRIKQACETFNSNHRRNFFTSAGQRTIFPASRPGVFMRSKGDVIEEFTCKVVTVQPREADSCTVDLPVTYKNADYYLQSSTRILYQTSTQQLCSEAGAREYKTQSGNFIYALPSSNLQKFCQSGCSIRNNGRQ